MSHVKVGATSRGGYNHKFDPTLGAALLGMSVDEYVRSYEVRSVCGNARADLSRGVRRNSKLPDCPRCF